MNFIARVIVLELLLISVLTWMLERSFAPPPADMGIERAADGIDLAATALEGHVLALRAGLTADYAPLARNIFKMKDEATVLASAAQPVAQHGRELLAIVERKGALVGRFAHDNAAIQNALGIVDRLAARLSRARVDPNFALAVAALSGSLSRLVRSPDPDNVGQAVSWLHVLGELQFPAENSADVSELNVRGHELIELVPEIVRLIHAQSAISTTDETHRIRDELREMQEDEQRRSDTFRTGLYVMAVLVSGLLVRAGLDLRSRTRWLDNRVRIENAAVKASSYSASIPPEQIEQQLDVMLSLIGGAGGAGRAYVLTCYPPQVDRIWCAPDMSRPPGWPGARREHLASLIAIPGRSIRMHIDHPSMPPALGEAMRREGVRSHSCAKLLQGDSVRGVLCFERNGWLPPEMTGDDLILDIVADVVASALQRRDAARRARDLEAKLRRAERLCSIGIFTSGIAHNLNNLLGIIAGQAELAVGVIEDKSSLLRHVGEISAAVRRGRTIVESILDYGRGEQKLPIALDLPSVLSESVESVKVIAEGRGSCFAYSTAVDSACVVADAGQLHQVFVNVMQNALQASSPGSCVTVRLDAITTEARRTSHGNLVGGAFVRVSVTDEGTGMDSSQQSRMFQPFFTTRADGTGLGLATAYQTISGIGGAFDVRSAPGLGTSVEVWLPIREREKSGRSLGGTVLLIGRDHDEVLRDEELLAALGFEPVGFADLPSALLAIVADADRFDVAIVEQDAVEEHPSAVHRLYALMGKEKPIVLSLSESDREMSCLGSAEWVAAVLKRPWRSTAVLAALVEAVQD